MGKKRNRSSSEQVKTRVAPDKLSEELPPPVRQSEEEPEVKKVKTLGNN
jgi:hypothetical protein